MLSTFWNPSLVVNLLVSPCVSGCLPSNSAIQARSDLSLELTMESYVIGAGFPSEVSTSVKASAIVHPTIVVVVIVVVVVVVVVIVVIHLTVHVAVLKGILLALSVNFSVSDTVSRRECGDLVNLHSLSCRR